jgi:hypothetical protein
MLKPEHRTKVIETFTEHCTQFGNEQTMDNFLVWLELSFEGQQTVLRLNYELMQKLAYDSRKMKKILRDEENGG